VILNQTSAATFYQTKAHFPEVQMKSLRRLEVFVYFIWLGALMQYALACS
jgi:hypothetical protein